MQGKYPCYASAAFGLEGLVASELRMLHMSDVAAENGGVRFSASAEELMLCNLRMHFCERVYLVAAEAVCLSFEDLFQLVLSANWQEFLSGDEAINVAAKCARSKIMSPRDCQAVAKKAIIEKVKRTTGRKEFPETGPQLPVHISVHSDLVKVMINTSGDALSRRGYRTWNGEAPLRETLAAALVQLSPWKKESPLYDPCCGTGTILVEAAWMAENRAPGLRRPFAIEQFYPFRNAPFSSIRRREEAGIVPEPHTFIAGSDISEEALNLAGRHIRQAGVTGLVQVSRKPLQEVNLRAGSGTFICNPPYGERLSDQKACRMLYRDLCLLKNRHPAWSMCVISSDPAFERSFGRKADKKRRLYNGRLECTYYIYS